MSKIELIGMLSTAVKEGNIEEAETIAERSVEAGYDPIDVLGGVTGALKEIGDRFGKGEMFLTELMFCAEAAKSAMAKLEVEIKRQKKKISHLGRVLIGTVAGDIHDIGKSIVVSMLTAEGFEVIDLGIDVPDETFIEKVRELKPDVLGMSALVSSTMFKFSDVIKCLEEAGLRNKVKVMIGGAFVDQEWLESSGADGFGTDAIDAVKKVKEILNIN